MKKLNVVLTLLAALVFAVPSNAATIISRTTLSAAVTSTSTTTVVVASATGITATSTALFIDGEFMTVNAVNSTTLSVTRQGRSSTHKSGVTVWFGPANAFKTVTPPGHPAGSCTRATELYLPWINVASAVISDCLGGVWVNGVTAPLTRTIIDSPVSGGAVLTGVGTSTTTTNTSMYCSEMYLPTNKLLTGLRALNGTAVGNGTRLVALYDASGILLANSATAGATTANASNYQAYAFTANYYAVGPATYFGCSQASNSSDSLNLVVTADGNAGLLTQIYTGQTFGTIPATVTAPSAYTTAQGPYFAFY